MPDTLMTLAEWKSGNSASQYAPITKALQNVYKAKTIYARFDAFATLIDECDKLQKHEPNHADTQKLKAQALLFAMSIVDAKDKDHLQEKIAARRQYAKIDPYYMPWNTPPTKADVTTSKTRKDYVKAVIKKTGKNILEGGLKVHPDDSAGEKEPKYHWINPEDATTDPKVGVKYLSETEREAYRIFPAHGKLKRFISDGETLTLINFDTTSYSAHKEEGKAIFVISPNGDMFAGTTYIEQFYHSSFLKAGATFYAGVMTVEKGDMTFLDNWSGHYLPPPERTAKMLAFFRKANLLSANPDLHIFDLTDHDAATIRPIDETKYTTEKQSLPPEEIDQRKRIKNMLANYEKTDDDPIRLSILKQLKNTADYGKDLQLLTTRMLAFQLVDPLVTKLIKIASGSDLPKASRDIIKEIAWEVYHLINDVKKMEDISTLKQNISDGLSAAIEDNNLFIVQAFIKAGIDLQQVNSVGLKPIQVAIKTGNVNALQMLIDAGAKLDNIDDIRAARTLADTAGKSSIVAMLDQWATTASPASKVAATFFTQTNVSDQPEREEQQAESKKFRQDHR